MTDLAMLQIALPKDFLALLGAQPQAGEIAKEFIVLGLYQEGRISGGKAAEFLGLTKSGFVALLARKGIDYFRLTPDEWAEEEAVIKAWNADHARGHL
jgi:predicted HTH domain antitoxin